MTTPNESNGYLIQTDRQHKRELKHAAKLAKLEAKAVRRAEKQTARQKVQAFLRRLPWLSAMLGLLATASSMEGMIQVGLHVLKRPMWEAVGLTTVLEISLFWAAFKAQKRVRAGKSPRTLMTYAWIVAIASGMIAAFWQIEALHNDPPLVILAGICMRLAVPLIACFVWEIQLVDEESDGGELTSRIQQMRARGARRLAMRILRDEGRKTSREKLLKSYMGLVARPWYRPERPIQDDVAQLITDFEALDTMRQEATTRRRDVEAAGQVAAAPAPAEDAAEAPANVPAPAEVTAEIAAEAPATPVADVDEARELAQLVATVDYPSEVVPTPVPQRAAEVPADAEDAALFAAPAAQVAVVAADHELGEWSEAEKLEFIIDLLSTHAVEDLDRPTGRQIMDAAAAEGLYIADDRAARHLRKRGEDALAERATMTSMAHLRAVPSHV